MEEWIAIPGYEGLYEASNLGRIRTAEGKETTNARCHRVWKQRILKLHRTKRGSSNNFNEMVSLWKNGEFKQLLVARLVAMTWCSGYKQDLTVNHIDGDPLNNKADNLEWITQRENILHAYKTGLNKQSKPCELINSKGDRFKFYSMSEASRFLGRNPGYLGIAIGHGTRIYSSDGEVYGFARRR